MPWAPELFSTPILQQVEKKWGAHFGTVPFFDGLLAGDLDALVGSFAGEPELHHPVRGRIRGVRAFEAFVTEMTSWLGERNAVVEDVDRVVTERHGFGEVVLHLNGEAGPVGLPVAIVSDRRTDGRIVELRIYFSRWALSGRKVRRPP